MEKTFQMKRIDSGKLISARKSTSWMLLFSMMLFAAGCWLLVDAFTLKYWSCGLDYSFTGWLVGFVLLIGGLAGGLIITADRDYFRRMDGDSQVRTIRQEMPSPTARLTRRESNSTLKRGRYRFSIDEWERLLNALHENDGRWTRAALERADIFDRLTRDFNEITAEFARMGVIAGGERKWRVTQNGWHILDEAWLEG